MEVPTLASNQLVPINVKEQELTKVTRKGYTVVEWGGTELG